MDLSARLGPLRLRTPLVAASGTVGAVVDWVDVGAPEAYGAAVAKSVSGDPWPGLPGPRLHAAGSGMVNAIGIENPGIAEWRRRMAPELPHADVPIWGSAVGHAPEEFALVAKELEATGVAAIEVNLSCPNLTSGEIFAVDAEHSATVVAAVRGAVSIPMGAKLSPHAADIAAVAARVVGAGADFLVLTNTMPALAATRTGVPSPGGLSGPPLKPVALRCVADVRSALPDVPIVGCGGVGTGQDVLDYMSAGADAVAIGTAHLAEPRAGRRILREYRRLARRLGSSGRSA